MVTRDVPHTEWVERLRDAVLTGKTVDLAAGLSSEGDRDPANSDAWVHTRSLPVSAIRDVLTSLDRPADPHGLRINGARITGEPDFGSVHFPYPMSFTKCHVEERINLTRARISDLILEGSHIAGLSATFAEVSGYFLAHNGFTSTGSIDLSGATVGGPIVLIDATITNPGDLGLGLNLAAVAGGLQAPRCTVAGLVRAHGATIRGLVDFTAATICSPGADSLNLDKATIGGLAANGLTVACHDHGTV